MHYGKICLCYNLIIKKKREYRSLWIIKIEYQYSITRKREKKERKKEREELMKYFPLLFLLIFSNLKFQMAFSEVPFYIPILVFLASVDNAIAKLKITFKTSAYFSKFI